MLSKDDALVFMLFYWLASLIENIFIPLTETWVKILHTVTYYECMLHLGGGKHPLSNSKMYFVAGFYLVQCVLFIITTVMEQL